MKSILSVVLAVALLFIAIPCALSQGPNQVDSLTITANLPSGASNVRASVVGAPGGATYYYWVITHFIGGYTATQGPVRVSNAPNVLAPGNSVSLSWTAANAPGVLYDILRTTTSTLPATPTATVSVVTGTAATGVVDVGAPLGLYTFGGYPAQKASSTIGINNRDYTTPRLTFSAPNPGNGGFNFPGPMYLTGNPVIIGPFGNSIVNAALNAWTFPSASVTAGTTLAATTAVSAGTTVTAGTGITATTGNITATTGNLVSTAGSTNVGTLAGESLAHGADFGGGTWVAGPEFAIVGGQAVYTFAATGLGTMTQAAAAQLIPAVGSRWYRFQYDVVGNTMATGVLTITGTYALAPFQLDTTVGVNKVAYFFSAVAPTDFVLDVTGATAGVLTLDNVSLRQVLGGDINVAGRFLNGGVVGPRVDSNGDVQDLSAAYGLRLRGVQFTHLAVWAPANGTMVYCEDCDAAIAGAGPTVCASTPGTGTLAIRLNGAWTCLGI